MTIFKAVTNGNSVELSGKEVAIKDDKIARCPGCSKNDVPVTKNEDYGLLFIGHHNFEARCGGAISPCDYSGEPLKIIGSNEQSEPEQVLH